jgi:putative oxidoreductase
MFSLEWTKFSWASRYNPGAHLVFRIATSLIFIIGGLGHFGQSQVMMARIEQSPSA